MNEWITMRLTTNTYVYALFSKNPPGFQFKRRSHKFHYLGHIMLTTPPICRSTALYERNPSITKTLKRNFLNGVPGIPLTDGSSFCPCLHVHVESGPSTRHQFFFQACSVLPPAPLLVHGNPTAPSWVVSVWRQEGTEQHCPVCQYLIWSSK